MKRISIYKISSIYYDLSKWYHYQNRISLRVYKFFIVNKEIYDLILTELMDY